jgi:hypothetical protein
MAGLTTARPGAGGRRWFGRRGDLSTRPFPTLSGTDLPSRLRTVDALRAWAEAHAEDAIDWYLRDKRAKRVASRALRAGSIVLAVAGGTVPLASAAWRDDAGGWGYVLLAAAAGCAAFDHFFGVSAGWMRDIATSQALRGRLERFRLEWTSALLLSSSSGAVGGDGAGAPAGPVGEPELAHRLGLVRDFVADVTGLVEAETSEWLAEFRANIGQLYSQAGLAHRVG